MLFPFSSFVPSELMFSKENIFSSLPFGIPTPLSLTVNRYLSPSSFVEIKMVPSCPVNLIALATKFLITKSKWFLSTNTFTFEGISNLIEIFFSSAEMFNNSIFSFITGSTSIFLGSILIPFNWASPHFTNLFKVSK